MEAAPRKGSAPVSAASRIVVRIEDELRPRLAARTHPLLGASTVSVGRVCGGTLPNVVAECCEIDIDRRTIPGEDDPLAEIEQLVKDVRADIPGLTYTIEESPATRLVPHVPLGTPRDESPRAVLSRFLPKPIASRRSGGHDLLDRRRTPFGPRHGDDRLRSGRYRPQPTVPPIASVSATFTSRARFTST